ncbi:MAG: glucosaminidase domain-containing protein [Hyphomicrobium sp.]
MKNFLGASLTIAFVTGAVTLPVQAADLPDVKASPSNQVPACATPGRLMAYVQSRNRKLDSRFDGVAIEYMRHGETLGVRWDMAFFQMMLETGSLSYTGDVRSHQNNFAGLGATGKGNPGESFENVSTGVKAHMQHLLMYAGEHLANPVAERTRKIQEWGILTKWQNSIKGPMTFSLVAKKWAPGSHRYVRYMKTFSGEFYDRYCNAPDPRPELVQEARKGSKGATGQQIAAIELPKRKISGAEIAKRNIEEQRKHGARRSSLGGASLTQAGVAMKSALDQKAENTKTEQPAVKSTLDKKSDTGSRPGVTILNSSKPEADPATAKGAEIQTASVAGAATKMKLPDAAGTKSNEADAKKADASSTSPSPSTCKVWTASYGGQRAIIIKAKADNTVNYTVLDVHKGSEKREADAYIAAYAKGGEKIGDFPSQTRALNKAFKLCPEG